MNPCHYGFKCPYSGYGDDGCYCELICTYPTPYKDAKEDTFPLADETDCELCDPDSWL